MLRDSTEEEPTLRALLSRRELDLRILWPTETTDATLDAAVRWVHSSDLADPTPFLSQGLALLTTGTQFHEAGEDGDVYDAYVERLSARGVVAVGFGTEVARTGVPPELVRACAAWGVPLFEVPYPTPFIAVARANAEAVAAQAYRRRSWALAAQRAIALAALRRDGLGATLAELARQLGTWVGLFDAGGELAREHPPRALHAGVAAQLEAEAGAVLRRGARAASSLSIEGTPFTLQTLGRGGHLRGAIAIASGDLDHEGRGVVTAVVAMAGLALEQNEGLARAVTLLRTGLLDALLRDDAALPSRVAHEMWGGLPAEPVLVAICADARTDIDALAEWLEVRSERTPGGLFFARGEAGLVVVIPESRRAVLDEIAAVAEATIGVSDPTRYDAFARAYDQARFALARTAGAVTTYAQAGRGSVLDALPPDARAVGTAVLGPLSAHDAEHGTDLVATLLAHLTHDSRPEATARALGIHRHTVRARIALAERVLGRDLSTFAARADVWAAFVATGAV